MLKQLGLRRIVGSGRGMAAEDGTDGWWQAQLKVTSKNGYKLNAEDLAKLARNAFLNGQAPLFAIYFSRLQVFALIFPTQAAQNAVQVKKSVTITTRMDGAVLQVESITAASFWKVVFVAPYNAKKVLDAIRAGVAGLLEY